MPDEVRSTRNGATRCRNVGEEDGWPRAQAPATRMMRLSPGEPRQAKGRTSRASGHGGLAKRRPRLHSRGVRREVHGDARSCGVLADLIDCRSAKSRSSRSWQGSSQTLLPASASVGPLGPPSTAESRSRRGRREQEVILAWKRGSSSLLRRRDEDLASRRGRLRFTAKPPLARHVPRRSPRRGSPRWDQLSRVT